MCARKIYTKGDQIGNCIFLQERPKGGRERRCLFKCECGKEFESFLIPIKKGGRCGCKSGTNLKLMSRKTHGYSTRNGIRQIGEYTIWAGMKARCLNQNNPAYKNYGGRGITIDSSWLTFEGFIKDMGDRPTQLHSIERVDNNKGYYKDNCIWILKSEQAINRRTTRRITFQGKTLTTPEWSKITKIYHQTILKRLKGNWPIHLALTEPIRGRGKNIATILKEVNRIKYTFGYVI